MINTPEIFLAEKCIGCNACATGGECYAQARVKNGREVTINELWNLIATDIPYYQNSGGGITFSGGEAMLQHDFLVQIVSLCRGKGIHTAVDTAGHVPYDFLQRVNPDMFLYDIKAFSPQLHEELTGVDGELIWNNLERLTKDNFCVKVRIPCIPGANWDELPSIFARLHTIGISTSDIELLPYHRLGEGKSAWLGKEITIYVPPSKKEMDELWNMLNSHNQ